MHKIISLFKRNYEGDRKVYNEVVPGAEWVISGEGIATEKFDGTACMIQDGILYKRYDCKRGKAQPPCFVPAQDPDPVTMHWPGWIPVGDGPEDQWHRLALLEKSKLENGTYELIGPKIQGNPYALHTHQLIRHGSSRILDCPRDFDGILRYLTEHAIEGIVWHNSNGEMVKIKARDFGIRWPRL